MKTTTLHCDNQPNHGTADNTIAPPYWRVMVFKGATGETNEYHACSTSCALDIARRFIDFLSVNDGLTVEKHDRVH